MEEKSQLLYRDLKEKDVKKAIRSIGSEIFGIISNDVYFGVLIDSFIIRVRWGGHDFSHVEKEKLDRFKEYIEAISWGNFKIVRVASDIEIAYKCKIELEPVD